MNSKRRLFGRALAATVAVATALSVAPLVGTAAAADPLPPLANPLGEDGVCEGAPTANPFSDLGNESASTRQVIICLVATELTTGTSVTRFTPGGTVTRRQMALFVKRVADLLIELDTGKVDLQPLPAYDGQPDYTDVVGEQPQFAAAIGQLTQAGIVGGLGGGRFGPNEPVSRRQMAAFINRLQDFVTGTAFTSAGKDYFDDDQGDSGAANLNALAGAGIFQGDGRGNVDPGGTLTRRQMANILLRYLQVHYAFGSIDNPFGGGANQTITVSPSANRPVETDTVTQFTASDIDADEVDIALVECRDVRIGNDGRVTFRGTNPGGTGAVALFHPNPSGGQTDPNEVDARITVINGAAVTAAEYADDVVVTGGSISFTVSNLQAEDCYVALVFADADDDDRLDLDEDEAPTEEFGVSGRITVVSPEAAEGATNGGTVTFVDQVNDLFSTEDGTYYYDENDQFQLYDGTSCKTVTQTVFEQALSVGDTLRSGSFYRTEPAGQSVFCLADVAPAPPTALATREPSGDDEGKAGIEVTFNESVTPTVVSYDVYRALATQPQIVGQQVTCPAVTANGAYARVGSVDDENLGSDGDDTHVFFDGTAQLAPDATPTNPSYCYYAVAVDEAGDVSEPSAITGPRAAFEGDPEPTAPTFTAAAASPLTVITQTVTVTYDQPIDCATVASNGSDFEVEYTILVVGPTADATVSAAACTTDGSDGKVDITAAGLIVASEIVVTAKTGTDGNTVGNTQTPKLFQAAGNQVQAMNLL